MENLTIKQRCIVAAIFIILLIIGYICLQYKLSSDIVVDNNIQSNENNNIQKNINVQEQQDKVKERKKQPPQKIIVHVCGQVKNSGVVELVKGSRINDAIKEAGGPLKQGDLDSLNLARILRDGEKVYVPKIRKEKQRNIFEKQTQTQNSININRADKSELDVIPGIGPVTAEKIIQYRKQKGFFKTIKDIKKVSGIGEKKFENMKKYITI